MPNFMSRVVVTAALLVSACKVGPNYVRPAPLPAPPYKEAGLFRPATPADALDRGPWWTLFRDPELSRLAELVQTNNQNVIASAAVYREALGIVREQRSALFPTLGTSAGYTRSGSIGGGGTTTILNTGGGTGSGTGTGPGGTGTGGTGGTGTGGNGTGGTGTGGTGTGGTGTGGTGTGGSIGGLNNGGTGTSFSTGRGNNNLTLGISGSWTPDLFGGTRRGIESARRSAEADAADLANMRLAMTGELVTNYLQLRSFDAERVVLDDTSKAYARDLQITKNRYVAGVAAKSDVLQAETQLLNAEVASADLVRQRGILEHAIAVLTGAAPSTLAIVARTAWTPVTPAPPPGIPSALLERRPDIAAAERRVAAANANVGVRIAAYYPNVTLTGSSDQSGGGLGSLFSAAGNVWSLGANIAYTLLDFGARRARVAEARAAYDQTVAQYRQTTLTAFEQVEDDLLGVRVLGEETVLQNEAAAASSEAEQIAINQYKAGTIAFTNVIVTQTTALTARRAAIQAAYAGQAASVALIQALGGGWDGLATPLATSATRAPLGTAASHAPPAR